MADYKQRVELSPFYKPPGPPTNPELIAAEMISEAHRKALELAVDLGEHLTHAIHLVGEIETNEPNDHSFQACAIQPYSRLHG
jgi:hypothetical protein